MKPNYLFKTRRQAVARARKKYSIKDYEGSIAEWDELLERNEEDALAWLGRFDCLLKLERKQEMLEIGDRVCELWPKSEAAHNNFACLLLETRQYEKACRFFDAALEIAPERNMYNFNAGLAYRGAGKLNEAATCFERTLDKEPNHQRALEFLSQLYVEFGLGDKLIDLSMRLRLLRPGYTYPLQRRLFAMMNDAAISEQEIDCEIDLMRSSLNNRPDKGVRKGAIKIAWIVCPFSLPFLKYVLPAFRRLRVEGEFEFVGYCNNPMIDPEEYLLLFDQVHQTDSATPKATIALFSKNPVDVLIDSAGQMPNNLMPLYSTRLAPLQITWPFFQSKTELNLMDQSFVDTQIQSQNQVKNIEGLSHRLTHLSLGQYFYDGDDKAELTSAPIEDQEAVSYGIVANPMQINQASIDAFAAVLKQVPNARLKLFHPLLPATLIEERLNNLLAAAGIESNRVSYHPRSSHFEDRYQCYSEMDILLSPFPLTDGLALADAMWMGVSPVALANSTIGHCRAGSILFAAKMSENLSDNVPSFISRAVALGGDAKEIISVRSNLRDRLKQSSLARVEDFVTQFLSAVKSL